MRKHRHDRTEQNRTGARLCCKNYHGSNCGETAGYEDKNVIPAEADKAADNALNDENECRDFDAVLALA